MGLSKKQPGAIFVSETNLESPSGYYCFLRVPFSLFFFILMSSVVGRFQVSFTNKQQLWSLLEEPNKIFLTQPLVAPSKSVSFSKKSVKSIKTQKLD